MSVTIKPQADRKSESVEPSPLPRTNGLTVISKVLKNDTFMVMADAAREMEDEFQGLYVTANSGSKQALSPPYNPLQLKNVVQHNNVLLQCVQAMEVNIDGTGHEFVPVKDGETVNEAEKESAENFFNEPYPGRSFVSERRKLRQDLESVGWGFLEVLRNPASEVVAIRHVECQTMRLAKLTEPVMIKREIMRGGKMVELQLMERPRRFVQLIAGKTVQYYKEFGCPLDLNRQTGDWAQEGQQLPAADRATELLYFGIDRDATGPYYVPRWVNQMPSALGSRKAEEQNLEFLDSGGMPPAIIFIEGGQAAGQAAEDLRTYLGPTNKRKGRAAVVEITSTSGSLDASGKASVKVERFGAERANDAMYANYDKATEEHIRVGFRLPPLFLGKAADYNYATAVVAYQVAEAQVFAPERLEFDEILNRTVVKALGFKTLKFKSKPISMKSVDELFKALELVKDSVEGEDLIKVVNTTVGTELTYKEPPPPPAPIIPGVPGAKPGQPALPKTPTPPAATKQKIQRLELFSLVRKAAVAEGLIDGELSESKDEIRECVQKLDEEEAQQFYTALALYSAAPHHHEH
jgi:PBSX family phage portal protein